MTDYRIICCNKTAMPNGHHHIGFVGTGPDPSTYTRSWTLAQVLAAMQVDRFYTVSPSSGATALVTSYYCPQCQGAAIRSAPDAVTDNNLDNLNTCKV